MSAALGEGLKRLVPEGKWQSALANEWVELWGKRRRGTALPSVDTVEARLREGLQGRLTGIRYLFGDEDRRAVTWGVFPADEAERARLEALADEALRTDRPLRLLVDVTSGPQEGARADAMWEGLHRLLFGPDTLTPMALVLTEAQYERLPRSFDDFGELVSFQRVANAEAARARLEELSASSGETALVASARPRLPFERWCALRVEGEVAFGPPDALAITRQKGALEGLSPVTRPLTRIAAQEGEKDLPTNDPVRLRKLALALTRGQVFLTPDWGPAARTTWSTTDQEAPPVGVARRISWARQLGVEAAATEEEWTTALPKRLAPVPVLERDLLPQALAYAAYASDPLVVLADHGLHAVNPSDHVRAELAGLAVEVHEVVPNRRAALDAYFDAAASLETDALLADPFLEDLTAPFLLDDEARRIIGRAAATLLLSERLRPAPPTAASEPLVGLLALLAPKGPVEATLRLRGRGAEPLERERSRDERERERAWTYFVRPGTLPPEGEPWLAPIAPVTLARGAAAWIVCPKESLGSGTERSAERTLTVPTLGDDPSRWASELVASLRPEPRAARASTPSLALSARHATRLTIEPWIWAQADRELAFVLAALRTSLARRDEPLPLPNGAFLLPLGPGVFAELFVREDRRATHEHLAASLFQPFDLSMSQKLPIDTATRILPLFWGQADASRGATAATRIGVPVPHAVHLSGNGYRADVTFYASGLFAGSPFPGGGLALG
jgi:hypothetical protein